MPRATSSKPKKSAAKPLPVDVRLTHPERVVYEAEGITKGDVAAYFAIVAKRMLPLVVDRPLSMVRCPDGQSGTCFYQKHPPLGMSDVVSRIAVKEKAGSTTYLVVHDLPGLITLVQFGALEIHCWGSRADSIEQPDRLVFDLDPAPEVKWKEVTSAALLVRDFLSELKLTSFIKTTGGKGLHVVVPIVRGPEWPEIKAFCRAVADTIVAAQPEKFLANMSKAKRKGKIFIDYLRNERGATSIAPYSTRARPGAPVSMPLSWKQLASLKSGAAYHVQGMAAQLKAMRSDPWQDIDQQRQRLSAKALKAFASGKED